MKSATGLTPAQIEALGDIVAWLQVWLEGATADRRGPREERYRRHLELRRRAHRWHQGVHRHATIQALVARGLVTLATGPQVLTNGMRAPTITEEGRAVLGVLALEKMP